MRKLTVGWLLQREIAPEGTKPAPFPGKYPTKIAWRVRLEGDRIRTYVGKPVKVAAEAALNFARREDSCSIWAWEFDRKSVISSCYWTNPRLLVLTGRLPCSMVNGDLQKFYHFWEDMKYGVLSTPTHLTSFLKPTYVKRIKVGDKIQPVYSPHERLRQLDHLAPFKEWVAWAFQDPKAATTRVEWGQLNATLTEIQEQQRLDAQLQAEREALLREWDQRERDNEWDDFRRPEPGGPLI